MKKGNFVLPVICCLFISCWNHDGRNTSIRFSESGNYYTMEAWFHKKRTRAVETYMDGKLGRQSNMSFANTRIDGELTLDDRTTFFIKKSPGHIRIEFDRNQNSVESYHEIRSLCQGIKGVLE